MSSELGLNNAIEQFLKERHPDDLSPFGIHASISSQYYQQARVGTLRVLRDGNRMGSLGYSSGGMRHHILYRAYSGIVYVIHNAYGEYNDAYYFTNTMLNEFFEGYEHYRPYLPMSESFKKKLRDLEKKMYGECEEYVECGEL